jgi:hypothetical protein
MGKKNTKMLVSSALNTKSKKNKSFIYQITYLIWKSFLPWVSRDEIFKTRSHVDMFQRYFFGPQSYPPLTHKLSMPYYISFAPVTYKLSTI